VKLSSDISKSSSNTAMLVLSSPRAHIHLSIVCKLDYKQLAVDCTYQVQRSESPKNTGRQFREFSSDIFCTWGAIKWSWQKFLL